MARRHAENMLSNPMPSPAMPWLVIFALVGCIVLVKLWALGTPDRLWGGQPPRNEYEHFLHMPAKPQPVQASPAPTLVPTPTPAPVPGEPHRVIGQ